MGDTLVELLERGEPDRPAVVVPGGVRLTYRELREHVSRVAEMLATAGIGRSDRVAIALPNGAEAVVAFLGASLAAVAAPMNPALAEDEFRYFLSDVSAKAIVVPPGGAPRARAARPGYALVLELRIEEDRGVRLRGAVPLRDRRTPEPPAADDAALVLHSSGTTGRPKRVALRQRHLRASTDQVVTAYRLGPDDVSLTVMPLFHVHGLVAGTLAPLMAGGTIVVPERFAGVGLPGLVATHRVTWYTAVPTIHQLVLARRAGADTDSLRTLRFVRSASAKLPEQVRQQLESRFGVDVIEAYGMTEAAHQIATNPLRPRTQKAGSVGCATGPRIAIMDDDGRLVDSGRQGEVVLRGPNVIEGYDGDPEADASAFVDGWFRTGDLGVMDEDGYLTLVGRNKEMINRGGEKISPTEVDEVLLQHPSVAEAVCFGVPHATWGEEVAAAVVLRSDATSDELIRHCRRHLAAFKTPKRVHLVAELPRTASGKVQRARVADAVRR